MIIVECRSADVNALAAVRHNPADLADDGTKWAGVVVTKPWGSEREVYRAGAVSMWQLTLKPKAETSMHCHPNKRTVLIVESGACIVETLAGWHELHAGDIAHIEPGAFHRTKTERGAVLLELETPPNKRDLVRLLDKYGRVGQGYERAAG